MSRVFGLRTYRIDVPTANTPVSIFPASLSTDEHQNMVETFRVYSLSTNSGVFALGDKKVTVNTGLVTDGEPISPSDFTEWGVNPGTSSIIAEFDLTKIYIISTVSGDDFFVTYISKEI